MILADLRLPCDSGIPRDISPASFWVGDFETPIIELGMRAAAYEVEENDGFPFWHPWEADPDFNPYATTIGRPCPTCGGSGVVKASA